MRGGREKQREKGGEGKTNRELEYRYLESNNR